MSHRGSNFYAALMHGGIDQQLILLKYSNFFVIFVDPDVSLAVEHRDGNG